MEPNCILHLSSLDLISSASRSLLLSSSRLHEDRDQGDVENDYDQGGEDVEGVEDNVDDDVDDNWDKDDHQNKDDKLCRALSNKVTLLSLQPS